MEIITLPIGSLTMHKGNAKLHPQEQIDQIKESIKLYGFNDPIGIWGKNNTIVEGHGRYMAAKEMGIGEVPCIRLDHLSDKQRREYMLVHNQTTMNSGWDFDLLTDELDGLDFDGFDFGFDIDDEDTVSDYSGGGHIDLADRFGVPPFSVFDTRQGYWQDRKKKWRDYLGDTTRGRDTNLMNTQTLFEGAKTGCERYTQSTSEFDPVLCEIILSWFCPVGGSVFDPFAGGSVRGVISELTGHRYTGIDIRQEQIDENEKEVGGLGVNPTWICGDSIEADKIVKQSGFDLIMSCPPYGDLEVYSDLPGDISNKEYSDFLKAYREIVKVAVGKLADDRFAVFVVGDIRDKKGLYRGFVKDTICAFEDCGAHLYNEIILIEQSGTAAMRVNGQFSKARKVVKTHQNVLVFYKGDVNRIKDNYGDVYLPEIEE